MKKLTLLSIALLMVASLNLKAQNSTHKWAFGLNWQWEDFNVVKLDFPKQFRYAKWQGYQFPSAVSVNRYLNPSFNIFAQFGLSELEADRMDLLNQHQTDLKFWTGDLNLAYKFANGYIMKETSWFDPYIYLGVGASKINDTLVDNTTYLKQVTGLGFNIWLTRSFGLNFQAAHDFVFKRDIVDVDLNNDKMDNYMHYTAGIKFRIGPKDRDKDGIKDKVDQCPDVFGLAALNGCPDKDGDGIADKDDACPDVKGKPEFKGCPDTDGDGIVDKDDACPTIAGIKALNGCPDKDGDGIADKDDKCPDVPGMKALGGCPDKDGDGITDKDDACPEVKGIARFNGCPDTDGDGIADKDDKCPTVAGVAANNGCPEEKVAVAPVVVDDIYRVVYFDVNKSSYITSYTKDIKEVADFMKAHANVKVSVEGNTDADASDSYNMKLSEKRADLVIKALVAQGIDKARLVKAFYGETKPAADNSTPEGRAKNRRVEIRTIK